MEAETIDYKGYTIHVHYDECASNPFEEFDQTGILYQNSRRSCRNGKYLQLLSDFDNGHGDVNWNLLERDYIFRKVYVYEHSGICLRCGESNPFSCPWDSGLYGIIARSREDIRKEYNVKRISPKLKQKIEDIFDSEIKLYSYYLDGSVYGYTITDPDGEETDDSCWGFYGYDHEESGLLDHAQCNIDYYISHQSKSA